MSIRRPPPAFCSFFCRLAASIHCKPLQQIAHKLTQGQVERANSASCQHELLYSIISGRQGAETVGVGQT